MTSVHKGLRFSAVSILGILGRGGGWAMVMGIINGSLLYDTRVAFLSWGTGGGGKMAFLMYHGEPNSHIKAIL